MLASQWQFVVVPSAADKTRQLSQNIYEKRERPAYSQMALEDLRSSSTRSLTLRAVTYDSFTSVSWKSRWAGCRSCSPCRLFNTNGGKAPN